MSTLEHKAMSPTRFLRVGLTFGWFSVLAASGQQAPQDNPKPDDSKNASATNDPFSMDLDSLANTKVTTTSKFAEDLADAPGVMTVVSKDELKRFGGVTLAEILSRVAGLTLTSAVFPDHHRRAWTTELRVGIARSHSYKWPSGTGDYGGSHRQRHPGILSGQYP